ALRPGLELSLKRIVRRGAAFARVEAEVEFSPPEIETALEVLRLLGGTLDGEEGWIESSGRVAWSWTYPDTQGEQVAGRVECSPRGGWSIFRSRARAAHLLATQRLRAANPLE